MKLVNSACPVLVHWVQHGDEIGFKMGHKDFIYVRLVVRLKQCEACCGLLASMV